MSMRITENHANFLSAGASARGCAIDKQRLCAEIVGGHLHHDAGRHCRQQERLRCQDGHVPQRRSPEHAQLVPQIESRRYHLVG